ncbi:MAG: SapC family protein [Alphaproteobacteria bacterium]
MTETTPSAPGQLTGNVLYYNQPEPLNPTTHKGMGVKRIDGPFNFAAKHNLVPLTASEFQLAVLNGPIIFVGEEKTPLQVMGLNHDENIFVLPNGVFDAGVYVPAYVRRYPFVFANDSKAGQSILCVDRSAAFFAESDPELAFFDEKGEPTEYTQNCLKFCNDYEMERQKTQSFVQLLKALDLFEAKEAFYTPVNEDGTPAEPQKLADYFGVSEERLRALPTDKFMDLRQSGALNLIYAHLISLAQWDRLVALSMNRQMQLQNQAPEAANA